MGPDGRVEAEGDKAGVGRRDDAGEGMGQRVEQGHDGLLEVLWTDRSETSSDQSGSTRSERVVRGVGRPAAPRRCAPVTAHRRHDAEDGRQHHVPGGGGGGDESEQHQRQDHGVRRRPGRGAPRDQEGREGDCQLRSCPPHGADATPADGGSGAGPVAVRAHPHPVAAAEVGAPAPPARGVEEDAGAGVVAAGPQRPVAPPDRSRAACRASRARASSTERGRRGRMPSAPRGHLESQVVLQRRVDPAYVGRRGRVAPDRGHRQPVQASRVSAACATSSAVTARSGSRSFSRSQARRPRSCRSSPPAPRGSGRRASRAGPARPRRCPSGSVPCHECNALTHYVEGASV